MTKGDFSLFENNSQNAAIPLIIVCDEKDMVYANYLIQLIGQKDDAGDSIVGIADDSVSAAIYTTKTYKDNLPQIPFHAAHHLCGTVSFGEGTKQNHCRQIQQNGYALRLAGQTSSAVCRGHRQ